MKTVLLMVVAIAPAALRWWWARAVMRDPHDPALPERLLANTRRNTLAIILAVAALVALSPGGSAWTIPLLFFARLVAGYPIRRRLFGESWSLGVYLSCFLRAFAAFYGLWILVALLPLLAWRAGTFDWIAGPVIGVLLLVWNLRSAEVVRRALLASDFSDPMLLPRFVALADAAGVPRTRFGRIDLRGGIVANAVALPSLTAPTVLFTDSLLARLDAAEVVAICAHELAHLEFYNATRLRRMHVTTTGLIIAGAALAPALRVLGISSLLLATAFWCGAVVAVAAWRARDRQRNETSSDLRAAALCGDAEALVRGLTTLYTIGRVPRRLDPQYERQATHPSLARRIRDIRRAAGTEAASVTEQVRLAAPDAVTAVTFAPDSLHWSEGEAATHTLRYSHLAEVRVVAKPAGPSSLVVVEHGGRKWTMTLDARDVATAQAALDRVDGRLAEPPPPSVWPRVSRMATAFAALVAVLAGHVTPAILAAVAALKPSAPLLAAAAFGLIATAALNVRQHGVAVTNASLALLLVTTGVGLLALARGTRDDTPAVAERMVLPALGMAVLLAVASIAIDGFDPIRLHRSAQTASPAIVLSIALAGALAWSRERRARAVAFAAAGLAAAVTVLASTWFLDRFGHDPLLTRTVRFSWRAFDAHPRSEFDVPYFASTLRLSPGGSRVAILEDEDEESAQRFHLGEPGRMLIPVAADDLSFVDDRRVLLLMTEADSVHVLEVDAAEPTRPRWQQRLPWLAGARLSVLPRGRWRVVGWNKARDVVRVEGLIGTADATETRWTAAASDGYVSAIATSGTEALVLESHYELGRLQRARLTGWMLPLPLAQPEATARLRWIDAGGRTAVRASDFAAQCVADEEGRLICGIFDGADSRISAVDAGGGIAPVASLRGRIYLRGTAGRGWVTCWSQSSPVAIRPATKDAFYLTHAPGEWIADIGTDDRLIATMRFNGSGGSTVRLYSVSE